MRISLWFMKNSHFNRALSLDFLYGYFEKGCRKKSARGNPQRYYEI